MAIIMTTCSEGDVITPEHAYADILNTAVMGLITGIKPLTLNSFIEKFQLESRISRNQVRGSFFTYHSWVHRLAGKVNPKQ